MRTDDEPRMPSPASTTDSAATTKAPWRTFAPRYERPDHRRWTALADTLIPFFLGWYLMYRSLEISYGLTLLLALPTGGFYIRAFAIFHDTTHFIWFKSQRANVLLGTVLGWLTLTPFWLWRFVHARHHSALGNLDRRHEPQIRTLTLREYLDLPPLRRLVYRVYRNPLVMIVLGGFFIWVVVQRFAGHLCAGRRERYSVYITNLALAGVLAAAYQTIGLRAFLMVHVPITFVGSTVGVWLYYVQHQYEDTYWAKAGACDYSRAALQGSIFLRMPPWFDWFTGYFTWHSIHHLIPRIPFYRLPECYRNEAYWDDLKEHTFAQAWGGMFTGLWDEDNQRLVGWNYLKTYRQLQVNP
jgi:omega-6 fatty acid desaturase (delta-12 desaturase)